MNKRIEAMILQCYNECGDYHIGSLRCFDHLKFARMIVRECAGIVNSLEQYEGPGDCSTAEYIKEHFGV